jgi:hypothetical protein
MGGIECVSTKCKVRFGVPRPEINRNVDAQTEQIHRGTYLQEESKRYLLGTSTRTICTEHAFDAAEAEKRKRMAQGQRGLKSILSYKAEKDSARLRKSTSDSKAGIFDSLVPRSLGRGRPTDQRIYPGPPPGLLGVQMVLASAGREGGKEERRKLPSAWPLVRPCLAGLAYKIPIGNIPSKVGTEWVGTPYQGRLSEARLR